MNSKLPLVYRQEVKYADRENVKRILESSGFFLKHEIRVAMELVEEYLEKGQGSGYNFVFAEQSDQILGYACFGPIACTACSYDLYWIAVHDQVRGKGVGTELLNWTENLIKLSGGCRVYVETSSRRKYSPTHRFYEKRGYFQEAVVKDFYATGDSKVIYTKVFNQSHPI